MSFSRDQGLPFEEQSITLVLIFCGLLVAGRRTERGLWLWKRKLREQSKGNGAK